MFIKVPKSGKYRGIGLKKFSELTDWYYHHIDVDFGNVFAYAKLVAKTAPIFSKSSVVDAPVYTQILKATSPSMSRVNTPKTTYTRV